MHFKATVGAWKDEWMDVEFFGCPRNPEAKESYEAIPGFYERQRLTYYVEVS